MQFRPLSLLILAAPLLASAIDFVDEEGNDDKRSIATSRGSFRPSKRDPEMLTEDLMNEHKRSLALGRTHFRPGKRSLAMGRLNFRPGKRYAALH